MKRTSHDKTRQCLIAFFVISFCMLAGAVLGGLGIKRHETTAFPVEDLINLPGGLENEVASYDAVGRRITISIHSSRSLVGLLAGGMIGLLIVLTRMKSRGGDENLESRKQIFSVRNIFYILSFLLLFLVAWVGSVITIVKKVQPLPDIRFRIIAKSMAIFAAAVSWVLVGRKIQIGQTIPRMMNWLLLGPFNYIRFKQFNSRQHKVIWVALVLIMYVILFPPWIGFDTAMDGQGIGDYEFVGFHFLLSDQYVVLGASPYAVAEISHKTQLFLIVGIIICTLIGVLYFTKRPYSKTSRTNEKKCPRST